MGHVSNRGEPSLPKLVVTAWFNWMQWMLVAGALYAIGKTSGSIIVLIAAWVSIVFLTVYGWLSVEKFIVRLVPYPKDPTNSSARWLIRIVTTILALLPFAVSLLIGSVLEGMVRNAG